MIRKRKRNISATVYNQQFCVFVGVCACPCACVRVCVCVCVCGVGGGWVVSVVSHNRK